MNTVGGSIAFRIFGISAICLSVVHFFVQRFLDKFSTKHGKKLTLSQQKSHTIGALGLDDKNEQNLDSIDSNNQHSSM